MGCDRSPTGALRIITRIRSIRWGQLLMDFHDVASAVRSEDLLRLRELLAAGLDPSQTLTDSGENLLHLAVQTGNTEVVLHLLGVVPARQLDEFDHYGMTPLSWAARLQKEAIVEALLTAGANPNAQLEGRCWNTPFGEAARAGSPHIIEVLLSHGADWRTLGWMGITPNDALRERVEQASDQPEDLSAFRRLLQGSSESCREA